MKITKEWLRKKEACSDGVRWFLHQKETDCGNVMLKLTKCGRAADALWLVEKIANKKQSVQIAVFSARLCINEFEKAFPNDNRPRKAIEAADAYIKNPCEKTKSAAKAAAEAAWSAAEAWSAKAAAWSAAAAARSARSAAAAAAAWSAAEATWAAAAKKKLQIKIIKEAISILGL